ncbi:MAG TPA: hypothetical protein VL361_08290 [Candidatus Limnocylindrales bacterium]|nr:hypothetical protein [Candidatus Limnocylindrales bacterium]
MQKESGAEHLIQVIDVRDVADWMVHCIEENIVGVYNATGPAKELSMKTMLQGIRAGIPSQTAFEWVDLEFVEKEKVSVESHFPLCAAGRGHGRVPRVQHFTRLAPTPEIPPGTLPKQLWIGTTRSLPSCNPELRRNSPQRKTKSPGSMPKNACWGNGAPVST